MLSNTLLSYEAFIALMLPFKEDHLMQTLEGVAYSKIRKYNQKTFLKYLWWYTSD